MSLELHREVPKARSAMSTATTESPRLAASRATPAPVTPSPTTRRSTGAAPPTAARSASRRRALREVAPGESMAQSLDDERDATQRLGRPGPCTGAPRAGARAADPAPLAAPARHQTR